MIYDTREEVPGCHKCVKKEPSLFDTDEGTGRIYSAIPRACLAAIRPKVATRPALIPVKLLG